METRCSFFHDSVRTMHEHHDASHNLSYQVFQNNDLKINVRVT